MGQHSEICKPSVDDRVVLDILYAIVGGSAVLVAHHLKLFPLLAEKPRTLPEVCEVLKIAPRPAIALLTLCVALGLVYLKEDHYALTLVAEEYLVETSPTYLGGLLDLSIANASLYSFETVKQAVLTDSPLAYGGGDIFKSHEEEAEAARAFTRAMHSHSMGAALAWPECMNLSRCRLFLDIGGGSGAHAIGAVRQWPNLEAIVFDLAPVCEVAEEFIQLYGLQSRIRTRVGDFWNDPFPSADLHFYSLIYHDFPPEKCRLLTRKSLESLESGGRIIVHEMLYNDEKTGPPTVAAYNIVMFLWTGGQQFSGHELSAMLADVGFTDIEVKRTFGYWGIVTGRKP